MPFEAVVSHSGTISEHDSKRFNASADVTVQRVQLESEEDFVLRLWTRRVQYMGIGERREERTIQGPALPPGWYYDINDPVLLSYDPYFRSHEGGNGTASAPLFNTKEGRYYADSALPLCLVESHLLKSFPPAGMSVTTTRKKTSGEKQSYSSSTDFTAERRIRAGEVIAMDVSDLCVVEDSLVWRFFPPSSLTYTTKKNGKQDKMMKSCTSNKVNGTVSSLWSLSLVSAARQIVLQAHAIQNGEATLVGTGYAQLLASFLLTYGDTELLPTKADTREALTQRTNRVTFPFDTKLQRSHRAEAFIERWCASPANSDAAFAALRDTAMLLLQCIPPALLSCIRKEAVTSGGCLSLAGGDKFVIPHYGFIRRMRLDEPDRLAGFLLVFSRQAVSTHIPDLPMRSGLFPFLRLLPHECRPNSFVMFLDCPASHCYGETGFFNYNTSGTRFDEEAKTIPLMPWGFPCSDRVFLPSVAVLVACRDIELGERISYSLFRSVYMTQPQRSRFTQELYGMPCGCRWCLDEPDVARAFRCPRCPPNCGVISPPGEGSRLREWSCLQCGYRPDVSEVHRCLDEERALATVKADKTNGLVRLLQADRVHYSHAIVFRKIDEWCQKAWQERDASMCLEYLDVMHKSIHRVLDPCDPQVAQVHEFTAQVNHAVGFAHTARYEYFLALQIRLRAGMRYAHWTRKTWFMAAEKSLAEFLDSV